ncbi:sigma factor-like helix-turn-helix DNA-binding protein [Streptosporangium sp. CA-135522]|uniref:sigma factor-like helix-turn-helix DNA-binding protein n=1 Tax=Streptosporangium sp. CA-135522 TaxID=3240072 RepID=UPI003D8F8D2C
MITMSMVDGDQMLLDGLTAWLSATPDVRLLSTARTVPELLGSGVERADVVILDLLLADRSDPIANVRTLVAAGHRVLVVSVVPSATMAMQVVRAGASGYLTKDHNLAALVSAVREVASGEIARSPEATSGRSSDRGVDRPLLSPQERAVLLAYASGMTLAAAARSTGVQPGTAKNYLERVKEKYRRAGRPAYTKIDLATRAREDGLLR